MVKDRQSHAKDVNQMLSDNGHLIIARQGVNVQRACLSHCTGLITVVAEGSVQELKELTGKIDGLYGIVSKLSILTD